ncbi:TlpA disulfide reductase family protein [Sphingobacterium faecale]|uniref:AhpC/TSA family protein n=1 Tax=Sphingobacterium faecale TaxID=2803775 RepID=A0ABS1QYX4_9SPHI|nr:TlpA disulfide reductase family protein [Sphingobacterium faecale]MBL1407214.1 AhpC/TSA family protein [Sphingobacterium faecale]
MKRRKLLSLLTIIITALTAKGQDTFTIEGIIFGNVEGMTVHLLKGDREESRVAVDSTIIKGGKFHFKGSVAIPEPYAIKIFLTDDRSFFTADMEYIERPHIPLFLKNSEKIFIEADIDKMLPAKIKSLAYDFTSIRVSGSKSNAGYMEYIQGMTPLWSALETVSAPYKAYLAKRPDVDLKEGIAAVRPIEEIDHEIARFYKKFIRSHGDNIAAVYALEQAIYSSNEGIFEAEEIDELLAVFSDHIRTTSYFKSIEAIANETKKYAVGQKFTDMNLIDPTYKLVKLSDHVGKGKYVLLDFWGPWCVPCRKEFPFVKQVYEQYHAKGLEILAISVDSHKGRWLRAIEEENLPWQNVAYATHPFTKESDIKTYAYWSIPFYLLIGPDGTIVDRNPHGVYLHQKMIEIFGE